MNKRQRRKLKKKKQQQDEQIKELLRLHDKIFKHLLFDGIPPLMANTQDDGSAVSSTSWMPKDKFKKYREAKNHHFN